MSQPKPGNSKFSLDKLPRPVIYGVPAALLIAGVGIWYFSTSLSGPPAPVEPATVQSTPPTTTPPAASTAPVSPAPSTPTPAATPPASAPPVASPTTSANTTAPSNPTKGATQPDANAGPSRSLEVQPIPFLVTAAPKTASKTSGTAAVTQSNPSNRQRVSVNPFAPLSVQPSATQATPTAQTPNPANAFSSPSNVSPGTASLPPIRSAPSVQISGTGQPLPSFPNSGNTGTRPSNPGTTGQMSTPKPSTVKQVPTAITTAKPQISAPATTPARNDVPTPLTAGALPIAPSILREVVPQGATDPSPGLTPVTPATPELPTNIAVVSTPTTPTQPSELKPPSSDPTTPTPLTSTTTTPTPPPPSPTPIATPPTTPTPTSTALSSFVLSNRVAFVGVIIGPVNTAIIETKDGTVIVPLGGTIPQSDVVVKSITAEKMVLMLGQETITIERSKK